jgi:hypothetical protein
MSLPAVSYLPSFPHGITDSLVNSVSLFDFLTASQVSYENLTFPNVDCTCISHINPSAVCQSNSCDVALFNSFLLW